MTRLLLSCLALLTALLATSLPARAAPPDDSPQTLPLAHAALYDGDADELNAIVERIHADHPELTELHVIGESLRGRPVLALAIGRDLDTRRDRPALLLQGGIHGDEPLAPAFVLDAAVWLLEHQDDPEVDRWLDELVVWCVPLLNPDGRHARHHRSSKMGRKNGRDTDDDGHWDKLDGVDLNRNFPFTWGHTRQGSRAQPRHEWYRGDSALSEPETQAMVELARSEHFFASVSYHMGAEGLLVPYTTEAHGVLEAPLAWSIARDVEVAMRETTGARRYPLKRNLYPVDGGDQDWLYAELGTLALLLEGGVHSPRTLDARAEHVAASRVVWQSLVRRYLDGPALALAVVDAAGQPVAATVEVLDESRQDWERWSTRCRDGGFHRYLANPDSDELRLRISPADGSAPIETTIELDDTRLTRAELRLDHRVESLSGCGGPEGWTAHVLRPPSDTTALRRIAGLAGHQLVARASRSVERGLVDVAAARRLDRAVAVSMSRDSRLGLLHVRDDGGASRTLAGLTAAVLLALGVLVRVRRGPSPPAPLPGERGATHTRAVSPASRGPHPLEP